MKLHYERWTCSGAAGGFSTELAEAEGNVELRLTTSVENSGALQVSAEYKRIDASGMKGEELRSGDLGSELKDIAAQVVLAVVRAGADSKVALPAAAQPATTLQSARFQDAGVGQLRLQVAGQTRLSNAQVDALAAQLNQSLSAKSSDQ